MSQLAHCPRDEQLNISPHPHPSPPPPSPSLPPRVNQMQTQLNLELLAERRKVERGQKLATETQQGQH